MVLIVLCDCWKIKGPRKYSHNPEKFWCKAALNPAGRTPNRGPAGYLFLKKGFCAYSEWPEVSLMFLCMVG